MLNLTSIILEQAFIEVNPKEVEDWGYCSTYDKLGDFFAHSS